jgi:hypothetical protein
VLVGQKAALKRLLRLAAPICCPLVQTQNLAIPDVATILESLVVTHDLGNPRGK